MANQPGTAPATAEVVEWLRERYGNCLRIAAGNTDSIKQGWLEDAAFFASTIQELEWKEYALNEWKLTCAHFRDAVVAILHEAEPSGTDSGNTTIARIARKALEGRV